MHLSLKNSLGKSVLPSTSPTNEFTILFNGQTLVFNGINLTYNG